MTTYHLLARTYPGKKFASVWLIRRTDAADSALLWGELLPIAAEEVAAALGLPLEKEERQLATEPMRVPECMPENEQASLFSDQEKTP